MKHYATVEIAERRASILTRWAKLKESLADWRSHLRQSQSLQQFRSGVDELGAWIAEKHQGVSDESYKDPTNLQGKLKQHEAFKVEVLANKERLSSITEAGKGIIM